MKDNDLSALQKDISLTLNITYQDHKKVIRAIKKDVQFFQDMKLMDYSLLLGIEHVESIDKASDYPESGPS